MNNISKYCLILLLQFTVVSVFSQNAEYIDFEWEESPKYEIPKANENQNVIELLNKSAVEFLFEDDNFTQYEFVHSIVYIAKEAGIEEYNRIYVPLRREASVEYQKIRVISENGTITELDEGNIKEGTNEESGYSFRYYAVEGLAVGSFLEISQLLKGPAKHTGVKEEIQSYNFQKEVDFEIICPDFMFFSFHSLNGLPEMVEDTSLEEKNKWVLHIDSMPEYKDEPVSYADCNLQAVVYKLSTNLASGSRDMSSYGNAANGYYRFLYLNTEKSEIKALEKLLKEIGINNKMKKEEKVRIFENHAKESYAVLPYVDESYQGIEALIKNKASDESTLFKFYANALKVMEVEHQVVITSDRTEIKFDQEFEAMNYLMSVMFYLEDEKLYLSPDASSLRLGFAPWENTANYGLFIEPLTVGDITTGIGKVKMIPALGYEHSQFNHRIKVDLTDDVSSPEINFIAELSGYHAVPIQTSYNLLSEDVKEKFDEQLKETFTTEKVESELIIENADPMLFGKKPLILKLDGKFTEFTENAGNKVIFNVGELIGEQAEMYYEKDRKQKVENDFNRAYYRTIDIKIPSDYEVDNLDKLNMDVKLEDGSAIFKSTYSMENGVIHIDIEEYYSRIYYDVEEFKSYQKVVNAAADFNKLSIILNRK